MDDTKTKDEIRSIDELEKAEKELNEVPKEIKEEPKKVIQHESKYPPLPTNKIIDKKNKIKEFNKNPNTKKLGVVAMKKSTYLGLWISFGLIFLILTIGMIWFNVSFTKKDFTPELNLNNNLDVPVNISNTYETINQNNYTIINDVLVNVEIGDELAEIIANRFLQILNQTNST